MAVVARTKSSSRSTPSTRKLTPDVLARGLAGATTLAGVLPLGSARLRFDPASPTVALALAAGARRTRRAFPRVGEAVPKATWLARVARAFPNSILPVDHPEELELDVPRDAWLRALARRPKARRPRRPWSERLARRDELFSELGRVLRALVSRHRTVALYDLRQMRSEGGAPDLRIWESDVDDDWARAVTTVAARLGLRLEVRGEPRTGEIESAVDPIAGVHVRRVELNARLAPGGDRADDLAALRTALLEIPPPQQVRRVPVRTDAVRDAVSGLARVMSAIDVGAATRPRDRNDVRRAFLRGDGHAWRSVGTCAHPESLRELLYSLPVDEVEGRFGRWLRRAHREIDVAIGLLESVDTPRFLALQRQLYGAPAPGLVQACRELIQDTADHEPPETEWWSAAEGRARIERFVAWMGAHSSRPLSVVRGRGWPSRVVTAGCEVRVAGGGRWDAALLRRTLVGDVATRLSIAVNSKEHGFPLAECELPSDRAWTEGTVVLAEYLQGALTVDRLRDLALRVLAVEACLEHVPVEATFEYLRDELDVPAPHAYTVVERVYRGGGVVVEQLPLASFVDRLREVRAGVSIGPLFTAYGAPDKGEWIDVSLPPSALRPPLLGRDSSDAELDGLLPTSSDSQAVANALSILIEERVAPTIPPVTIDR